MQLVMADLQVSANGISARGTCQEGFTCKVSIASDTLKM